MTAAWHLQPQDSLDTWQAGLQLGFTRQAERSVLTRLSHRGPLRIQRPLHPEGAACPHIYILHPPGGLVSGDNLRLQVELDAGAAALLTTPSSGKFYRARDNGTLQIQHQRFQLAANTCLEFLPQDTIAYAGCNARLLTRLDVAASARFCCWDLLTLGRPAAGETFTHGRVDQHLDVWRDGLPWYIERNQFVGGDPLLHAQWGLGGAVVAGTWLASLTLSREQLDQLREDFAQPELAFTQRHGLLIARYLGPDAEQARTTFMQLWQHLRPAINGRAACPPRIWNT